MYLIVIIFVICNQWKEESRFEYKILCGYQNFGTHVIVKTCFNMDTVI